jgi:uncharacterized membrane protein YgcG
MKTLLVAIAAALALTAPIKPAELDQLLAPIALYPDALLSQMLLCTQNPGKVGALEEWMRSQQSLIGSELQDAARAAGFEASFVALTVFPDVVEWMAGQPAWMASLGGAFTDDRSGVFASIQRLRVKARDAGRLKTTSQQTVETRTTSSGQQVIVIEPANPQVVYVPQYNPAVVYTQSSTVVVQDNTSSADAVAAGLIGFTAGIAIGAAFDNDYYYGPYGWGGGFHMYDDAWDDWYDEREDRREDYADHREDMADERSDRRENTQEQRTDRQENRVENRPETQSRDTSRDYSRDGAAAGTARTGASSDAFSNYSSGKSERNASSRGKSSRSSSGRSGGSGGRRR